MCWAMEQWTLLNQTQFDALLDNQYQTMHVRCMQMFIVILLNMMFRALIQVRRTEGLLVTALLEGILMLLCYAERRWSCITLKGVGAQMSFG